MLILKACCRWRPRFVASGGLDNVVSIFRTPDRSTGDYTQNITQTLEGHDGYISCCRFLDDTKMLSSSGDATCMLWDISSAKPVSLFGDHSKDVTHLCALEGKGSSLFLSSSVDKTVILWDTRAKSRVMTITGHSRDVNCVDAFPDGCTYFLIFYLIFRRTHVLESRTWFETQ